MTGLVIGGIIFLCLGLLFIMTVDSKIGRFFGWCLTVLVIIPAFFLGADLSHRQLTTDVDLRQVAVKGENYFQAAIEIVYKDGEVEKVVLLPNTTISKTTLSTTQK